MLLPHYKGGYQQVAPATTMRFVLPLLSLDCHGEQFGARAKSKEDGRTPTHTPIVTPTQSTPSFTSASFVYDGDGKRVKSTLSMSNGSTTTYFVGGHYEVVNGVVTKYYFAGSQRIALRTNGTLNYLFGDHLGSTSLTTDANGQVISEMRYKAWGETRYASGTTPTKYQYTGQYSYASDFGLHFYNARWYDSSLSRFASADTIIPGGVQGLDRYAYVNNAPVRYTDPTGHWCEPGDFEPGGYCWSPSSGTSTPPTLTLLVCGISTATLCDDTPEPSDNYAGMVPLNQFYNWAISHGSTPKYYSANTIDAKAAVARLIADEMHALVDKNSDATIMLVGHSAGADTVILAVAFFLSAGGRAENIKAIVLLDSYIYSDSDPNNIWDEKDTPLDEAGAISLPSEKLLSLWSGDPIAGFPNQTSPTYISPQLSYSTGKTPINDHYGLAINVVEVMDKFNQFYGGLP